LKFEAERHFEIIGTIYSNSERSGQLKLKLEKIISIQKSPGKVGKILLFILYIERKSGFSVL
jgi:hypothetical protein